MKSDDVKRLKELERENATLKRIVADKELEGRGACYIGEGKLAGPARRRRAVAMLRDRLGVSERWACRVCSPALLTAASRQPVRAEDDAALRAALREFSRIVRGGGIAAPIITRGELGWDVNRKRVQRLWREEGLRVPVRRRKRRRLGDSTVPAERLRAERPNQVWAFDFQFDQTADGRVLKLLNVVDRVHPRSARDAGRAQHRRRHRYGRDAGRARRRAWRPRVPTVRQRPRDDRARAPRLVRVEPNGDLPHPARLAVAEPVRRELPLPRTGRAAGRRGVPLPGRRLGW